MLRVSVERVTDDGFGVELLHQVLIRRRPGSADDDHLPVDVRLARAGQRFTSTAIADWDGPVLRRETDTLGVLVNHTARHPLLTTLDALQVLLRRILRSPR